MGRILAKHILTVFVVALLLIGMLPSAPVDAQSSPITVLEQSLTTDYKKSAVFHLKASTTAGTITKVGIRWHYRSTLFLNFGSTSFTPAQEVVAEYTWSMQTMPYIPWDYVYAKWEITDSAGNKLVTQDTPFQVTDATRNWKELKVDNIAVYTYDQPDSFAQDIITVVRPVYDRMVKELNFTPTQPLGIVIYNAAADICSSRVQGECDPDGIALLPVFGSAPGFVSTWAGSDPAEFKMYLQASAAMSMLNDSLPLPSSVNDVPTWMYSGLFFYYLPTGQAERTMRVRELAAQDNLLHLDQFSGAYAAATKARDKARLLDVYMMEASTVTFIIEKVGIEGMMKMLALMKSGKKTQTALKEVTGYDFATFETAWSEWAGVKTPFVVVPTPTDSFTFPPTPTFPPKK